jgi:hypothetical protein
MPIARSYAGFIWEGVAPLPIKPECDHSTNSCVINFTDTAVANRFSNATGTFMIQTQFRLSKSVTKREAVARLMIQSTFGVNKTEIDAILDTYGDGASNGDEISNNTDTSVAAAWFAAEVQKSPTYLRQRYRLNTNPRMYPDGDYAAGEEYGRCEIGSRWHRYAFNYWDKGRLIDMRASAAGVFQLLIDGVLRTEVPTFLTYTWSVGHPDKQFYICGVSETSDPSQNRALFTYPTDVAGASCSVYNYFYKGHKGINPTINFIVPQNESTQIYNASEMEFARVKTSKQGVYYMKNRSSNAICIEPGVKSGASFLGIRDATRDILYYKFEPRMKLVKNTVDSPAAIKSFAHGDNGVCPLTPKTFINDGTCIQRRNDICTPLVFAPGVKVTLNGPTLRKFYLVSQKYVYVVKGLRLLESTSTKFHKRSPCRKGYIDKVRTPEGRAPFIRTAGSCPSDARRLPADGTEAVILAALRNETGPNSADIRDIAAWRFTASNGGVCSTSDSDRGSSR